MYITPEESSRSLSFISPRNKKSPNAPESECSAMAENK